MTGIKAGGRHWPGFSSAPRQGKRTHCGLVQRALVLLPPPLPTPLKAQSPPHGDLLQGACRQVPGSGGQVCALPPHLCVSGNTPHNPRGKRWGTAAQDGNLLWFMGVGKKDRGQILAPGAGHCTTPLHGALLLLLGVEVQVGQQSAGGAQGPRMARKSVAGPRDRDLEGGAETLVQTDPLAGGGGGGGTYCAPRGSDTQRDRFPTPLIDSQTLRGTGAREQLPPLELLGCCWKALGELDGGGRGCTGLTGRAGPL